MPRTPSYFPQQPVSQPIVSPYASDFATVLTSLRAGYGQRQAADAQNAYAARQAQDTQAQQDFENTIKQEQLQSIDDNRRAGIAVRQAGVQNAIDRANDAADGDWNKYFTHVNDGVASGMYDEATGRYMLSGFRGRSNPQAGGLQDPAQSSADGLQPPPLPADTPAPPQSTLVGGSAAPTGPLVPMQAGQTMPKGIPPFSVAGAGIQPPLMAGVAPASHAPANYASLLNGAMLAQKNPLNAPSSLPPFVPPAPLPQQPNGMPQSVGQPPQGAQTANMPPAYNGPHIGPLGQAKVDALHARTAAVQSGAYQKGMAFIGNQPQGLQQDTGVAGINQALSAGGGPTLNAPGSVIGTREKNWGLTGKPLAQVKAAKAAANQNPQGTFTVDGTQYTAPQLAQAFPDGSVDVTQGYYPPDVKTQAGIDSKQAYTQATARRDAFNQKLQTLRFQNDAQKERFHEYIAGQDLLVSQGRLNEQQRENNIRNSIYLSGQSLARERLRWDETKAPAGVPRTASGGVDPVAYLTQQRLKLGAIMQKASTPPLTETPENTQARALQMKNARTLDRQYNDDIFNVQHGRPIKTVIPGYRGGGQSSSHSPAVSGEPFGGVQPQVAASGKALASKWGFSDVGGYASSGHEPDSDHYTGRALDFMTHGDDERGQLLVNDLLANKGANARANNVKYIIWRQRLYYPNGTSHAMPDRGSPTANHFDHVHVSYNTVPVRAGARTASAGGAGKRPNYAAFLPK